MGMSTLANHVVEESHARQFADWIRNRGGLCVWPSVNMSNLGISWTTPRYTENGVLVEKPTWQAANSPERVIMSTDNVDVVTYREVKRFRVAVRRSGNGLSLKCTDGATRRIDSSLARAGDGATYRFDYETQEAVILVPSTPVTLTEWLAQHGKIL